MVSPIDDLFILLPLSAFFGLWIFPAVTFGGLGCLVFGALIVGKHVPHPYVVASMFSMALIVMLWYLIDEGIIAL